WWCPPTTAASTRLTSPPSATPPGASVGSWVRSPGPGSGFFGAGAAVGAYAYAKKRCSAVPNIPTHEEEGGRVEGNIFLAEMIGTMILILLGDGVVANVLLKDSKGENAGWIVITTGWAFAVAMGVFGAGVDSRSHINQSGTVVCVAA